MANAKELPSKEVLEMCKLIANEVQLDVKRLTCKHELNWYN